MNAESQFPRDELEAYLDDEMTVHERAAFERRLKAEADTRRDLSRRRALKTRIKAAFQPPVVSVDEIEKWLPAEEDEANVVADIDASTKHLPAGSVTASQRPALGRISGSGASWPRRALLWGAIAVAASVAGVLLVPNASQQRSVEPFFQPRSLAELYRETVSQGFRPYYLCEDETRFAQTFAKRQGVPLRLAPLPAGRTMVGLSYLGGMTRDTTAMLCRVDGQPVVVFVDRQDTEPAAILDVAEGADLFVHTSHLGDLVLFEVTPWSEPKMLDYLQIAEPQ